MERMLLIYSVKLKFSSQTCFRGQTSSSLFTVVGALINILAKLNTFLTHLLNQREFAHLISECMHWLFDTNTTSADVSGAALLIKVCITSNYKLNSLINKQTLFCHG